MKRKTKIATVLTAAMLLAIGTAFTSQAAWEQQGGNWIFTDTSGNRGAGFTGEYRYEFNNGTIYYVNNQRERLGEVTQGAELPDIAYLAVYPLYHAAR